MTRRATTIRNPGERISLSQRILRAGLSSPCPMSDSDLDAALAHPRTWRRARRLVVAASGGVVFERRSEPTSRLGRLLAARAVWRLARCDDATALALDALVLGCAQMGHARAKVNHGLLIRHAEVHRIDEELRAEGASGLIRPEVERRHVALNSITHLLPMKDPAQTAWSSHLRRMVLCDPTFASVVCCVLRDVPPEAFCEAAETLVQMRERARTLGVLETMGTIARHSPVGASELWELTLVLAPTSR